LGSGSTSWIVSSMNLSTGSNKITAKATDNSSNTYETSVNVTYSLPGNTLISSGGGREGSSGGGGGGGGPSGENVSNIELIERSDLPIYRNVTTFYRFTDVKDPVMFVNITGNTTMDIITALVVVLKGTSTLVKTPPEGLVYKNVNIWVGTPGFATSRNIKEASIKFRVENSWMSANNVTSSDIVLVKWNGNSWIELETNVLSKDDTNTFFEGKTITFSSFAIIARISEAKLTANADSNVNASANSNATVNATTNVSALKTPQQPRASQKPAETAVITRIESSWVSTWSIILIVLIMNIIIVALYFLWVKK
ncbi:MAG TPA: PGF-pre-PGF domain-containing protein, partial [Candidatus Methanoperedens sp.]